jgi:putative ABC transport system permease protein
MGSHRRAPPRLPLAVLRALLRRAERHEVLSEVEREYAARAESRGRAAADRWLWRQALASAPMLVRRGWWREWSGFEPGADTYHTGGSMLRSWIADAHYAARRLRARPGYTLLAVLTLALGVGGTAAVYGVARGLLFDPLPYPHEQEVGVFWKKTDWTEEEFLHIRGRVPGFQQVALYRFIDITLREEEEGPARLIRSLTASTELFDVLGTPPLLGRGFRAGEDVQGADPVAVLSYGLWQELGADPAVLGTRLTLSGACCTVVGVMPRGFWFPDPSVRLWIPEPLTSDARSNNSTLIGRVAPGQNVRALAGPIDQLTAMLDERFDYMPQWDKTIDPSITPIRDDITQGMRPALLATLVAMGLILLIACANVAALMLRQTDARSAELAVRLALGANGRRITQQLVIEALFLAAGAGALAGGLAWAGFRLLVVSLPLGAWTDTTMPDWTLFVSAMTVAIASALLVALVPTLSLRRADLRSAMGSSRTVRTERKGGRLEGGLVVAEVALAVLIATGAAQIWRSVTNLYALDPGVRTEGLGVLDLTLGGGGATRQKQTIEQLRAAIGELPGVGSVAAVQVLPLRGGGYNLPLGVEGRPEIEGATSEFRVVTPGYLETMGFDLQSGRTIEPTDRTDTEPVVVINETLARRYFAGVDPVGQRLHDVNGRLARIVGVVRDAAERQLTGEATPARYVALEQMPWVDPQSIVLEMATGSDPAVLLDAARAMVGSVAPGIAVRQATTMTRVLDLAVGPARQVMSLLSLLTGLALVLGTVGIYGVTMQFAARRQRDYAIRVALGLPAFRAATQVVGHGTWLVLVGIALGSAAAAGLTRLLSSLLYGVGAFDLVAVATAGAALLGVGLLAAVFPACRTGRTDPAIVLREQ